MVSCRVTSPHYLRVQPMKAVSSPQRKVITSVFITALLLLQLLIFTPSVSAEDGNTNLFNGGFAEKPITLTGGNTSVNIGFDSPRNITLTHATFDLSYDYQDSSPGEVWVDVNEDGVREWSWNGTGKGDLGDQQLFANGQSSISNHLSGNSTSSIGWLLPSLGTLQTSDVNFTFSADLGGFWQTGALYDIVAANVDSDSSLEVVFLSPTPGGLANSSTWIGVSEWDALNNNMTPAVWYETCENSTSLRYSDVNNDSIMDIAAIDFDANMLCLHLSNSTSGGFKPVTNISLPEDLVEAHLADITGDGMADIISAHASGNINLREWDSAANVFSMNVTQMVEGNNTIGMPATLSGLLVEEFYGQGNGFSAITFDGQGYATSWNLSASSWVNMARHFDGMNRDLLVNDFNGDGYLDILGSTDFETSLSLFNGTGWNSTSIGVMLITNATITDYDLDGNDDLLIPNPGTFDGQDSTFTGSIMIRSINGTSIGNLSTSPLTPWTYPEKMVIADLDGDGVSEHIISAGESSRGFFAGGYHNAAMDLNNDGSDDVSIAGYSGDGNAGVGPIYWRDMENNIQQIVSPELAALAVYNDSFGNSISHISPSVSSAGAGTTSFSDLQMKYDITLTVNSNPYLTQNFTNVLNQNMLPGNSSLTFLIPFPINSTKAGSLLAKNFFAEWIAGAPNIQLPATPTASLYSLTTNEVGIVWEAPSEWGLSFINFQVFRTTTGGVFDLFQPIQTGPINISIDTSVTIGNSYDYAIRTVHEYGVTSNLSNIISVVIPYPSPPSLVENVSVIDAENDLGGVLNVSWTQSSETFSSFNIYAHSQNFTTVSNLAPVASVSASVTSISINSFSAIIDSNGTEIVPSSSLQNGVQYWVSVVAANTFGNQTNMVSPYGPVIPRNDSLLPTTLSLDLSIDGEMGTNSQLAIRSSSLSAILHLELLGVPAAGKEIIVELSFSNQVMFFNGTTDSNGDWQPFDGVAWSTILSTTTYVGGVIIEASYAGYQGDIAAQPIASAQTNASFTAAMEATLSVSQANVVVDSAGNVVINLNLAANISMEQHILQGLIITWGAGNGSQIALVGGQSIVGTSGSTSANVLIPGGGWFRAVVDVVPGWLILLGDEEANATINPYSDNGGNGNTSSPTEIIPIVLSCDEWELSNNASISNSDLQCTLTNTNSFSISLDWTTSTWVFPSELDLNPNKLTIDLASNAESGFKISSNYLNDLAISPGNITIQLTSNTRAVGSSSIPDLTHTYELNITISDDIGDQSTTNNNTNNNGSSGNTTDDNDPKSSQITLYIVIGVIAFAAIAGIVIVLIKNREEEIDWEEDDLEYDDPYGSVSAPQDDVFPAGLPLDEVKPAKRSRPKPIVVEDISEEEAANEDPFDISRKSGDWEDNSSSESEEEWKEGDGESWEEDGQSEDEGISTDEDGTEWYEDEVGVWWYRTVQMEDWAEFEE